MIQIYAFDERLKDNDCDALRRSLYKAKETQARQEGYTEAMEEWYQKGRTEGFDEAIEMILKLILDFKRGNIQP